eukprot:TRINITY_DN2537_c0_g1_i1.p1 TRINITY_DN2537_c0_g1~~TRINITY_DN2537_c0_g1_i1.p1  ORF type:complete len:771 (-),score=147.25 TRINITY_DN2537_c0_g1_i1:46-2304(-)
MDSLPDEVLLLILGFVDARTLLCSAAAVSRRFRRLCGDNRLWHRVCARVFPSQRLGSAAVAAADWRRVFQTGVTSVALFLPTNCRASPILRERVVQMHAALADTGAHGTLAVLLESGVVRVFAIPDTACLISATIFGGGVTAVFHTATHLMLASSTGAAELLSIPQQCALASYRGHTKRATACLFSEAKQVAVTASVDCSLAVFTLSTGQLLQRLRGHEGPVHSLVWSPDAAHTFLCSSGTDGDIRAWQRQPKTGLFIAVSRLVRSNAATIGHAPSSALLFAPFRVSPSHVETLLLSGFRDGTVCVWRHPPQHQQQSMRGLFRTVTCFPAHFSSVVNFAVDPARSHFASCSNAEAKIWRVCERSSAFFLHGNPESPSPFVSRRPRPKRSSSACPGDPELVVEQLFSTTTILPVDSVALTAAFIFGSELVVNGKQLLALSFDASRARSSSSSVSATAEPVSLPEATQPLSRSVSFSGASSRRELMKNLPKDDFRCSEIVALLAAASDTATNLRISQNNSMPNSAEASSRHLFASPPAWPFSAALTSFVLQLLALVSTLVVTSPSQNHNYSRPRFIIGLCLGVLAIAVQHTWLFQHSQRRAWFQKAPAVRPLMDMPALLARVFFAPAIRRSWATGIVALLLTGPSLRTLAITAISNVIVSAVIAAADMSYAIVASASLFGPVCAQIHAEARVHALRLSAVLSGVLFLVLQLWTGNTRLVAAALCAVMGLGAVRFFGFTLARLSSHLSLEQRSKL